MREVAPKVTVIVTHHLDENRPYLDLCLNALEQQTGVSFETIVVADSETVPEVPRAFTLVHNRDLNNATKKVHFAIAMSDPKSQYFLLLSDDVILASGCLSKMVEAVGESRAILNPMSNSDNGGQFIADIPWPCNLGIEDLSIPLVAINLWQCLLPKTKILIQRPYICFYCTLIPREVWEAVGPLDERLENRHNDQDWCMRAAQKGIGSYIHLGAFALHFGSKTLNKVASEELRNEASRVFMAKWPGAV